MNNTPATIVSVLMETNNNAIVKVVEDIFEWKENAYQVNVAGAIVCNLSAVVEVGELLDELCSYCESHYIDALCWKQANQQLNKKERLVVEIEDAVGNINWHPIDTWDIVSDLPYSFLNDHKVWCCMLLHTLQKQNIHVRNTVIKSIHTLDGCLLVASPYADGADSDCINII